MRRELTPASIHVERPVLVWNRSAGAPVEFSIWPEQPLTIGRDATNAIAVESPFVSKAHAVVVNRGGQFIVEDLNSANGTRVNGAPVAVYVDLKPGDVIEVGDQQLVFVDRGAPGEAAAGGGRKLLRLVVVAGGTGLALIVLLMLVFGSGTGGAPTDAAKTRPESTVTPVGSGAAVQVVDTALINEVEDRARRAGVSAVDALYDEGVLNHQSGRHREAVQLFAAVLQRDPKHVLARNRLAEAQAELETMIATELAEGNRAAAQLRFADAILAYEKVLVLTYPSDARNRDAQQRLDQARQRTSR